MSRLSHLPLLMFAALAADAAIAAPTPITIEQAMADPDWIGPPVESAWWSWNSQQVEYKLKRKGSPVRDTFRQPVAGGIAQQVADDQRGTLDVADPVYDRSRSRSAFVRNGDVFVRDLRSGALTQLTRGTEKAAAVGFARDGGVTWRVGQDWFHWTAANGITRVATLKAENNPADPPKADELREQQLRLDLPGLCGVAHACERSLWIVLEQLGQGVAVDGGTGCHGVSIAGNKNGGRSACRRGGARLHQNLTFSARVAERPGAMLA